MTPFSALWQIIREVVRAGNGSIYTLQVPLYKHFHYDKTGTYQYSIVHGMRDDILKGMNGIGLKLEIVNGEE